VAHLRSKAKPDLCLGLVPHGQVQLMVRLRAPRKVDLQMRWNAMTVPGANTVPNRVNQTEMHGRHEALVGDEVGLMHLLMLDMEVHLRGDMRLLEMHLMHLLMLHHHHLPLRRKRLLRAHRLVPLHLHVHLHPKRTLSTGSRCEAEGQADDRQNRKPRGASVHEWHVLRQKRERLRMKLLARC
jgi:hypothetical protein